ncbi:hypothetical protein [Roseomonas elaeocarpi]|uniref:Uncharacterized protein n=1 Tax=Roseomonas elaeocarpi TaxID=907779 RepID=A0ABV6JZD6_9PROT
MRRALPLVLLLTALVAAGPGAALAQKPPPLDAPDGAAGPAPERPATRVPDLPGKPPALPPGASGRGTPAARTPRNTRPATPPAQGRPATPTDQPPAATPPTGKPLPAPGPGEREA